MTTARYFTPAERIAVQPVWSNEYDLNRDWSPLSLLLDEVRRAAWWTATGLALEPATAPQNHPDSTLRRVPAGRDNP